MHEAEFLMNSGSAAEGGFGRRTCPTFVSGGDIQLPKVLPKVSVRTVVPDELVDSIVDEMVADMGNATFGDGKIFVREIADAIRVRANERGDAAL